MHLHDPDPVVSTRQLCNIVGVTYRQADYWVRCGYLLALEARGGQGSRRYHPASEVAVACGLAQLLRAGCRQAGEAAEALRSLPPGFTGPVLLDEAGQLTDDLDQARWVVQMGVVAMPVTA